MKTKEEIQQDGVENLAFDGDASACGDLKSGNTEEISTMEELLEAAGTNGRRNYLIYFFCVWVTFMSPFLLLSYQFLGATPEYWCQTPELERADWTEEQMKNFSVPEKYWDEPLESCEMLNFNYSEAGKLDFNTAMGEFDNLLINNESIECKKRSYDSSEPETVVTKWDLVCERRVLYSTTQAAPQLGKFFSSVLMGYLMNVIGRKKVLSICIPLYLVVGLVTVFSPTVQVYIALKFVISVIQMAFPLGGMVLAFELCSTSQRSFIGSMFFIPISIGFMILPGIAYFIRPFAYLHIALTLPILTLFPCLWILPESPRWLVLKGRYEEAIQVLQKIAKFNGRLLPPEGEMINCMHRIRSEVEKGQEDKTATFSYCHKINRLLLDPSWSWKVFIIFFGWTSGSMIYYGVSLNSPNLSQDKYLYAFLAGLLELPSCLILWPSTKYFGRKNSLATLYLLCATAIVGAAALSFMESPDRTFTGWLLFLSLLGKFSVTSAYSLIWFYTIELIPTEQRSEIVGLASMCGRIGSVSSPYIVDLLGEYANWIPSAIFGGFALVAGLLIIFLPETKNSQLSESK